MKESCHSWTNFKEWLGLFDMEMFRFVGKTLSKCILFRKVNFALNCMKYHFSWQQMWYLILIFLSPTLWGSQYHPLWKLWIRATLHVQIDILLCRFGKIVTFLWSVSCRQMLKFTFPASSASFPISVFAVLDRNSVTYEVGQHSVY